MKYIFYTLGALALLVTGFFFLNTYIYNEKQVPNTEEKEGAPEIIGGDRDEHGCLIAAGYSFDERVDACTRAFELTPDIAEAALLAVKHVGAEYGLTVVLFNSYEEPGAYDITLERKGGAQTRETIYIRDGQVVPTP